MTLERPTPTLDPWHDACEVELVAAIGRWRRRRRLRVRSAAVVGLTLVLVTGAVLLTGLRAAGPQAALAITENANTFTVRVTDAMADDRQMNAELAAAGVPARVQSEPVEPAAVGQWIALGTVGPATPEESMALVRQMSSQVREHPAYLTIAKTSPVRLMLIVGRPAASAEAPCAQGTGVVVVLDGGPCDGGSGTGAAR